MNRIFSPQEQAQAAQIQLFAQQSYAFVAQNSPKQNSQMALFDIYEPITAQSSFKPYDKDNQYETYEHCQRLLMDNLPEARRPFKLDNQNLSEKELNRYNQAMRVYRQHKKIREDILEAKNVFLTGKEKNKNGRRGACGRSAALPKMLALVTILENWIRKGANAQILLNELNSYRSN